MRVPGSNSYAPRQPGSAPTRCNHTFTAGWLAAKSYPVSWFGYWRYPIIDRSTTVGRSPITKDRSDSCFSRIVEIIQPVFQKAEHVCVGRRCKDALETVRRHIARQFVIIPEQPT